MYTFSKNLRLLKYNQFLYVFKKFRFNFSTTKLTILGNDNFLNYPRIGISISKKHIKYSYERNRIKRLIREYFRLHQHCLPKMDFIVLSKNELLNLSNKEINKNLEFLWKKSQN